MWISSGSWPGPSGIGARVSLSHSLAWVRRGVRPVNVSAYLRVAGTMYGVTLWWT